MTDQEARNIFDQAIEAAKQSGNADATARIELVREFLTNQSFREALNTYSFNKGDEEMAKRMYRNPEAVIRAAARKIGGRLAFYDGVAVLHQVTRNTDDQIVNEYLSAEKAARLAGLRYDPDPDNRYEFAA